MLSYLVYSLNFYLTGSQYGKKSDEAIHERNGKIALEVVAVSYIMKKIKIRN